MSNNIVGGYKGTIFYNSLIYHLTFFFFFYYSTALPLRFSSDSSAEHTIFIKEHSAKLHTHDKPKGRTLFVSNIPPYTTKKSLLNAFHEAGSIKNVIFEGDNDRFKTAYIIFNKNENLKKAIKLETLKCLSTDKHPILTGMSKWVHEYNNSLGNDDELKNRIKQIIEEYDRNESNKKSEINEDDDGWTLVTKNSRNPGLANKESVKNKLNDKRSKKHKQLKNFYTFQIRESKKNHIANLRKKYEEDKKRVEALKSARKFKPF